MKPLCPKLPRLIYSQKKKRKSSNTSRQESKSKERLKKAGRKEQIEGQTLHPMISNTIADSNVISVNRLLLRNSQKQPSGGMQVVGFEEETCCQLFKGRYTNARIQSRWFLDVVRSSQLDPLVGDWFQDGFWKELGDGSETSFWSDKWLGDFKLKDCFPRLYMMAENKNDMVCHYGSWEGGDWAWDLRWRRDLFVWERELLSNLIATIEGRGCRLDRKDSWRWGLGSKGSFEVKAGYLIQNPQKRQEAGASMESLLVCNSMVNLAFTE
ncbi:hypothetical protein RIF29_16297 [Crotalaria pallida]|uniref:Uncharacterized protein n=1 Tax=Crotalaria pallida TaxID=3830 RepID=A0AAN9FM67_CROPI